MDCNKKGGVTQTKNKNPNPCKTTKPTTKPTSIRKISIATFSLLGGFVLYHQFLHDLIFGNDCDCGCGGRRHP
ncbi:hypothetical protein JTB14_025883 [Gonioctena quinquepunctata]|nr:hypothetical protein JTB14_025883 [Gonioctena quinquepunctata]